MQNNEFRKIARTRRADSVGLIHDSRADVRLLAGLINQLITEVEKCQKRIVQLEAAQKEYM